MRFLGSVLFVPTVAAWSIPASRSFSRLAPLQGISGSHSGAVLRVLGISGGIGSGKSAACKTLVNDLGCWAHLEAGTIAHNVYKPNSQAVREIVHEFGSQILTKNGEVDRKQLGAIVFSSPESMSKLERIVWPHVKEEIQKILNWYQKQVVPPSKVPILVLEAAVLVDAGWDDLLDGLWVIKTPEDVALSRLQSQRGLIAEDARTRIQAQKVRRGIGNLEQEIDDGVVSCVITNDTTAEELKAKLAKALHDDSCWYD